MSLTYAPAGELGSGCPSFALPAALGGPVKLDDFKAHEALVVMFICNHCPYVRAIEDRLLSLAREFKTVGFIAICSNDPNEYPEDAPAALAERARDKNYPFPYLIDESQEVARAFGAVCTPDIFMYGKDRRLAYRGRLDDAWKNPANVKKRELAEALEVVLAGKAVKTPQNPSMGCSIKWKKGD
ncbi:MAG TPA: thioredoxin family protein [Bdellovibrionales bacterium]|nr:thioredoxin family protein [Bdellovibrionales bacterium]